MTNKEYIESKNMSFAEGLKLWDKDRYPDFSDWLTAPYRKFKVGDVLKCVVIANKYVVLGVDVKDAKWNKIYPYNLMAILTNGEIEFTPNEDVENGTHPVAWADETFDNSPHFVKIA